MVVYIDVLLIENFIVNMFLLYITAQTLRVRIKLKFLILAALVGTIYVLTLLFQELAMFTKLPFQILVAGVMIIIGFRKKPVLFNLKSTGLFILYSMLLSGFCVFLQLRNAGGIPYVIDITDFSYKWLIVSIMIIYMIIHRFIVLIRDRSDVAVYTYTVDIVTKEFTRTVKAFLDTGNELREPVTNLPVMIVERNVLKEIDLKEYDKMYIPYRVVNGSGGRMEGFKPKCIKIYHKDNRFELRDVIIGFSDSRLSDLGDYEALLSRGII